MIPRRVCLRGFLCYREEQEIDFAGSTLWMLAGLNGSGKPAIFDGVTYALFGHHRGGSQHAGELINKDADALAVEFDFGLDGDLYPLDRIGRVRLSLGELEVYWIQVYGGGVFIPFRDATNGSATYGAGRYLVDAAKSADLGTTTDGRLILDFNFATQPSCAFDPKWACPLAPPENRLDIGVSAGERLT